MHFTFLTAALAATAAVHAATLEKRQGFQQQGPQFTNGQPIDGKGKGGPIAGGTNEAIDLQNPDNLGQQSTDAGFVPNLKWSFSDSKTRIFNGGWVREQVINDLPASHDIAAAQLHLNKGAIRELHWHRTAEWGYVYAGKFLVSAVDENGRYQVDTLEVGDAWYFPKGQAHSFQGLEDSNEFLVAFDDGDFEKIGTTFMVDDWINRTPKRILAKNFGVNETVFSKTPNPFPYITNSTVSTQQNVEGPNGALVGNSSYVYHARDHPLEPVPGEGGTFRKIDSTTFPIATTISAAVVTLEPHGLRELHWHPNAEEWLYFHQGTARATVFIGNSAARTWDFRAGDTAVFPDNSGHYIENTSDDETLVWLELYKSDRVADISLSQWLALTPHDIAARILNVDVSVIDNIKKEKQLLLKA